MDTKRGFVCVSRIPRLRTKDATKNFANAIKNSAFRRGVNRLKRALPKGAIICASQPEVNMVVVEVPSHEFATVASDLQNKYALSMTPASPLVALSATRVPR